MKFKLSVVLIWLYMFENLRYVQAPVYFDMIAQAPAML